jgi:hypothetical protein
MGAPKTELPPLDPAATAAAQTAQNQLITSLQTTSRSDSASLMAQYGSLASATGGLGTSPSAVLARAG